MTGATDQIEALRSGLERLRVMLDDLPPSASADVGDAPRRLDEEAAALLYMMRRLDDATLPRLAVMFGPTGAGKSTLFNLLCGRSVSHTSSVERPATRGGIAAAQAEVARRAEAAGVFATFTFERTSAGDQRGAGDALTVVPVDRDLGDHVLVDSPDYNTTVEENRDIAARLLVWADRIVFVTSVERYADRSAEPWLRQLARLATPVRFVLNKVDAGDADLAADLAEKVAQMNGPATGVVLTVPRRETAAELTEADAAGILEFVTGEEGRVPLGHRCRVFTESLMREVVTPLREFVDRRRALVTALGAAMDEECAFEAGAALTRIQSFEEESRFWLRYSPRSVLKGIAGFVKNPRSAFTRATIPSPPDQAQITSGVAEQAWRYVETAQIVARETLKSDAMGRAILGAADSAAAEMTRDELRDIMAPLGERLWRFSNERIERFKGEWEDRRRGVIAQARFWAVDKTLKLLVLGLSVAVLPPLLYELLRFIGHPNFTNEVTKELEESRRVFGELVEQAMTRQRDRYSAWVDGWGPAEAQLDEMAACVDGPWHVLEEAA